MSITTTRSKPAAARRQRERRALAAVVTVFAAFILGAAGLVWVLSASDPAEAAPGGPFRLTAGDGRIVTDQDFRGKYLLVYFGYTICPDVCPTTLQTVTQALATLGSQGDRVQPLLVTVDPAHDTPAVLAQYTAAFSPRLIGLSGTPEQIVAAEKAYRVYVALRPTEPGAYTVDHSSVLFLMGPDGRFVAKLRADASVPELAAALAQRVI